MKIHIPALVHRDANADWEPDAYVGKIWRLSRMLVDEGHDVVVYGGPHTDTPAENVTVVTDEDRQRWFGDETWEDTVFNEFDPMSAPWMSFNSRTAVEIGKRIGPEDVVFLTMGRAQAALQQAFAEHVVAECGVGYEGVLYNTPRCFESESWRHFIYGRTGVNDGRYYDTVIPNPFDPDDYIFSEEKSDYLLFMGRLTPRKGLEVVQRLAREHRVVTAGQGEPIEGVEHVGVVKGREKAELLAGARAVLCPTTYIEPFGGVAVEAMLSGTPVIASPFGAFTETVLHGHTGLLCRTLAEFLFAAETVDELNPVLIQDWAMERYTLNVCAPQYTWWISQLLTLYGEGWYA